MIKAIIFDLDNTLIDFMKMKRLSCEAAIEAMISAGLEVEKEKGLKILFQLYSKYGLEYQKIFQVFLKKILGRIDYGIMASGIVAYRRVKEVMLYPYPNVVSTLNELKKKYRLAILSDAPKIQAWIRLAAMQIQDKFDLVITYDETRAKKPNLKPFLYILKKLKLNPEECLIVGDSLKRDVAPAKKLGFKTVFAKYGSEKEKAKIKPNYIINDIKDLLRFM
ncbi:MAG: TIGR02253 family HAD-type hydrolase [Candidatus Aenigmarchaeota archaeon]|nr:TIGR02253 family HAD-type hydrolase [Candidatus Aenigmarchaeota archaeon]